MPRPLSRPLYLGLGWTSLGLGFAGIFLPVLPTTPFVLLAAYCFSKSSRRWHAWLCAHPRFGPLIRDWEAHRAVRTRAKVAATALIVPVFALTLGLTPLPAWAKCSLAAVGLGVLAFLWTRPVPPACATDLQEPG